MEFGVNNLRRLVDIDPVEIKPITLLLGKNSAGKSTFLRTFPLVSQSLKVDTHSPILWFGDYVDLGSYKESVYAKQTRKNIEFVFKQHLSKDELFRFRFFNNSILSSFSSDLFEGEDSKKLLLGDSDEFHLEARITLSSYKNNDYISKIVYCLGILEVTVVVDNERKLDVSIKVGEDNIRTLKIKKDAKLSDRSFFPNLGLAELGRMNFFYDMKRVIYESIQPHVNFYYYGSGMLSYVTIYEAYKCFEKGDDEEGVSIVINNLKELRINQKRPNHITDKHNEITKESIKKIKKVISEFFCVFSVLYCSSIVSSYFRRYFQSLVYVGPARDRADRYYRNQELAVEEISSDGKNFPVFLHSLDRELREGFSNWVKNSFGFGVETNFEGGHISILISEDGDSASLKMNAVDAGYGISQILPVLAQIWWGTVQGRKKPGYRISSKLLKRHNSLVAIEQPELHLHPAHQALIGDVLATEVARNGNQTSFLVETHSEALVYRLGDLIAKGKLNPNDVAILIFEKATKKKGQISPTQIRTASFDSEGCLINWPYGFFQPEDSPSI